jgi:hypothetical protein
MRPEDAEPTKRLTRRQAVSADEQCRQHEQHSQDGGRDCGTMSTSQDSAVVAGNNQHRAGPSDEDDEAGDQHSERPRGITYDYLNRKPGSRAFGLELAGVLARLWPMLAPQRSCVATTSRLLAGRAAAPWSV